jgi:glycosyltransferase involved in cell wall biosynthesis
VKSTDCPPYREISVVYPAYNEEANVRLTLDRSIEALKSQFERFEIIIVDDGSTDQTLALLNEYASIHPEIIVLSNETNSGAGDSMLRGMMAASCSLVVNNAMDYPFDLSDLSKMCPLTEVADVVVAAREGRPGYTLYRHFLSRVNWTLLRVLFGLPLSDLNFVQIYKQEVLQSISVQSRSAGFMPAEMLIQARDQSFRIQEIEIPYHPRLAGKSVMGNPKVALTSLMEMLSFWVARRRRLREVIKNR